jgi:hypothetical protein
MAGRWHGKGSGGVVGKKGRRGWGRIRRLPSSGRYQANYVGPTEQQLSQLGRASEAILNATSERPLRQDRTRTKTL